MRCEECGRENKPLAVFCKFCGARMEPAEVSYWSVLRRSEKLLSLIAAGAMISGAFLILVSTAIHVSGGGTDQPSYMFSVAGLILMVFGSPGVLVLAAISHKRYNKVVGHHKAAGARQKPPFKLDSALPKETGSNKQLEQLVLKRAKSELDGYRSGWWLISVYAIVAVAYLTILQVLNILQVGNPSTGAQNIEPFTVTLLLAYGYFFVASTLFIRYPRRRRMREIISRWRTDPTALAPPFTTGEEIAPHGFMKPMLLSLVAIWVTQFVAFPLFLICRSDANLVPLLPYCYLLVVLSFGGMVLHRLQATRAVVSALTVKLV